MKKTLFILLAVVLVLAACNRKKFVKEIVGTWNLQTYLLAGQDLTTGFDTTYRNYQLVINDGYRYSESWKTYGFIRDSIIHVDTIAHDTINNTYTIQRDTFRFIDTTITPHFGTGVWALLNSEEDLQLRDDSDATNPKQYRILTLNKSQLNLLKGNEERHLKH